MTTNQPYNYEKIMLPLNDVMDLIDEAIRFKKPLSLGRFGHGELAYLGWPYFPQWTKGFEPHSSYAGATASLSTIRDDLNKALRITDIVGFHASWGGAWEDREAAKLTSELLQRINFRPIHICSAFITHEMIKSERFWTSLKERQIALIGRRAVEARPLFENKGVNITYTTNLEGYTDIEKVYLDLVNRQDWDIAFLAAGIPAKILAPRLATQTNRVAIDFGHALDKLIDGENFDYRKILKYWKEGVNETRLISIVMAVYNGERFLKEALKSALSQTYPHIEIIIVDDGSTDSTKAILNGVDDERVKVIHFNENQGAAHALNTGIRQARGSWIAIHDADDNSYPTKIEEQVKYIMEHPQLVGVGTLIECIQGSSNVSDNWLKGVENNKNTDLSRFEIRKKIYWGCPLTHSSVMFPINAFWEAGGYNPEFKIAYDYDLWLRLLERGEIEKVPKVLLQYRIYNDSLSNQDSMATVNEIQLASSKAIYRRFNQIKQDRPRVMVIGPKKGCKNYEHLIGPSSGLKVDRLIYEEFKKRTQRAVKSLKEGEIDAIIVLDFDKSKRILNELERKGLELNKHVFNLYNTIM